MNKILTKIFGNRFRVKLHIPLGGFAYYRVYYSNSFGIFWGRVRQSNSSGVFENVMLSISDLAAAKNFAEQFKSIEDVRQYETLEYSKCVNSSQPRTVRIV